MDYRSTIIDTLEFHRKSEIANQQPFKARAYSVVLKEIQGLLIVRNMEDLKGVKGMGDKITQKIQSIFDKANLVENKEKEKVKLIDDLLKIYGVGPVKANELVKKGISSISHLKEQLHIDPSLLHEKQKIGLRYYDDLIQRIPWSEMKEHEAMLEFLLPIKKYNLTINIVGSFRRGLPSSGDIDVLIRLPKSSKDKARDIISKCFNCLQPYIKEILAYGPKKFMGISQLPHCPYRRIDLLFTPYDEYAYSLLYFTGSDQFNVSLRKYCIERGYRLNEHGLTSISSMETIPSIETEAEIFQFLGLHYKHPVERISAESIDSI